MLPRVFQSYLVSLKTYTLRAGELRRLQTKKTKASLTQAYASVRHYRESFRRAGVSPADFNEMKDIAKFPLLTKSDVLRDYPDGMLSRRLAGEVVKRGTGTSGTTISVPQSEYAQDVRHSLFLRRWTKAGVYPWNKIVSIWLPVTYWRRQPDAQGNLRPTTSIYEYPVWFLGRSPPNVTIIRTENSSMEKIALDLLRSDPDVLMCRPSLLRKLGRTLEAMGKTVRPRVVFLTNEMVTSFGAREIERMFETRVVEGYGSAEFGGQSVTCQHAGVSHLNEDYLTYEVLRDGEPVGSGEAGELVMTSLHNDLMPLIRFRTGDLVKVREGGVCECGTSMRILESAMGRVTDWLSTGDGRRLNPMEVAEHIEAECGLRDFQIVQKSLDDFVLKVSPEDMANVAGLNGTIAYLESAVGRRLSVEVQARTDDDFWRKSKPLVSMS